MKKDEIELKVKNMENYTLVEPYSGLEKEFNQMVIDYRDHEIQDLPKYYTGDFSEYLNKITQFKKGIDLPDGYPTTLTYWMIHSNNEILGTIRYRKYLNEYTIIDGGHIGYDVPPSKRNSGYCTMMLKLLLNKLKEDNVDQVLLTVCVSNIPSIKVIENNGGILENEVLSESSVELLRRYWIYF